MIQRAGWGRTAALVAFLGIGGGLAGCASTGRVGETLITAQPADSARAGKRQTREATLYQTKGRLLPKVLLIDPGTTVRFENRDNVFHNAFSISPSGPFDVGGIAPGQARTVRFAQSGIIQVYCELHPREAATIIVAPGHARTNPLDDGSYKMAGLNAGAYLVRAWHPEHGAKFRRIELAAREHVRVDFTY
jgi:plastocyanin